MARDIEEPRYELVRDYGAFEVRDYAPRLLAQTELTGSYRDSLNQGFRRLARFIFGGNARGQQIAMTAPVGATVASSGWLVTFAMPAAFSEASLPTPQDERVRIVSIPAQRVAVLRFSGWVSAEKMQTKEGELRRALAANGISATGPAVLAQYNPPWTLPFLRRNELQLPVGQAR